MPVEESEETLLEKARAEENWIEALRIYEQVIKSFINKKNTAKAMEIYVEIHRFFYFKVYTVKTTNEFLNSIKLVIKIFKDGVTFFRQTGNDSEALECEAAMLLVNAFMEESIQEMEKILNKALELYSKLYEIHSKKKNQENLARISVLIAVAFTLQLIFCEDPRKFEEFSQKAMNFAKNVWRLLMDIGDAQLIALLILFERHRIDQIIMGAHYSLERERLKEVLSRCDESLKLIEDCNDPFALGDFYITFGVITCEFGLRHTEDDREQRKYFDKGMKFLEMSLDFARIVKNKRVIVNSIQLLNHYAILSGKVMYFQKRIINDLKEVKEAGKIFVDSTPLMSLMGGWSTDYLPFFYYANIAQWSFFTPTQRKSYAQKGIEHALKGLKIFVIERFKPLPYLSLTILYSVLARFSASLEEQKEYSKEMLKYANEANKIGDKYGGGESRVLGYSSLYKAYRTFADIANTEEERIKMLSTAADVAKKSLAYGRIESRTGIIAAQMRLGLLYEEIGVLTKKADTLMEAKELLLKALKGSLEREYYSYTATTYEYIARIEDRQGNHTASAESYKKAQETYNESLKIIEYKPLKNRVKEKIEYAHAWNLIETAKAYHKSENHLKAKSNYEVASEILKKVHRYNYEASYYSAWALLEEAEQLSKQERQNEAINQYNMTIKAFENAIKTLIEASTKSKEQIEKERINKLEKVAKIRINYCSARINLEEALILGKKGEHSTAAEKFAMAASVFRGVCTRYKLERERKELEAIYYLCRAWESMELAEKFEEPERFEYAANLFTKASNLFADTKLKLLASGNSAFCQALELGCKFDELIDIRIKTDLYPKVKLMLSKAASSYGKGGFENVANWALATSIYFDAAWHLIQADQVSDLNEKGKLLGIGSSYLKSAIELFGKAGYKDKEVEVQDRLKRVETEESILFSALSTIKEPSISRSTIGIVAPACPLESSQSPRLSEAHQLIEEERRVLVKRLGDSLDIYECDTNLNILHISDIQEGRFGIKEDISEVSEAYANFLSDLKDKLEILHRKNKIDIIVISGDLTSIGSKEEFDHLTNEFLPMLSEVFLKGKNIIPKNRWIMVPGNHDVEWGKGEARFNNFIQFCQDNGFHQYKLNNPESIYSRIICIDKNTRNTLGIITLNSCLDIFNENSPNISNISNSYFSSFSKDWDFDFREMPKLMVCHHTLHSIKKDRFNNALNKLSDNNVLLALAGDIHKSDSHADEISNIRCIPAGTILAKKTERQVGIDEVSRQFNLVNLNLINGYVKWYTYSFEGSWREIKNQSFNLEHPFFSREV